MSKFTTEVRFICENAAGLTESVGFSDIDTVLSVENLAKIMQGVDYPIFDEKYRNVLNKKILMHYYTREIGFETVGLWKLKLRTRLTDIMPYYNQLYKSELIEFNPMYDVDYTKEYDKNGTGASTSDSNDASEQSNTNEVNRTNAFAGGTKSDTTNSAEQTSENDTTASRTRDSKNKYSDTPQGSIDKLEEGTYLTNATIQNDEDASTEKNTGKANTSGSTAYEDSVHHNENESEIGTSKATGTVKRNSSGNTSTTENYLESVKGKMSQESYSKRLKEYRETFLNIDRMVIDELADLFMGLWE